MSGTAENRFLAPRNEFWGPRAQRQARLKTGPQRFPVALSQKIIAHLTFSLFLKFLGCYSELPEAPDDEKIEEIMKNQSFLKSFSLPSHGPPGNGPVAPLRGLQVSAVAGPHLCCAVDPHRARRRPAACLRLLEGL